MKALVVDDEESKLKLYSLAFQDEGYEVATARNGKEALRLFDEQDFGLITLDVTMDTRKEGIEVLRLMKDKKPQVPIIILTAYDYKDDFQVWAADAYIVKSMDLTELIEKAKELTGASKQ